MWVATGNNFSIHAIIQFVLTGFFLVSGCVETGSSLFHLMEGAHCTPADRYTLPLCVVFSGCGCVKTDVSTCRKMYFHYFHDIYWRGKSFFLTLQCAWWTNFCGRNALLRFSRWSFFFGLGSTPLLASSKCKGLEAAIVVSGVQRSSNLSAKTASSLIIVCYVAQKVWIFRMLSELGSSYMSHSITIFVGIY